MYCTKCGNEIPADERRCQACGAPRPRLTSSLGSDLRRYQFRHVLFAGILGGLAGVLFSVTARELLAWQVPNTTTTNKPEGPGLFDVVAAKRFVLLGKRGEPLALLATDSQGWPGLFFLEEETSQTLAETPAAEVEFTNRPTSRLYGAPLAGSARLELFEARGSREAHLRGGNFSLSLKSREGKEIASVVAWADLDMALLSLLASEREAALSSSRDAVELAFSDMPTSLPHLQIKTLSNWEKPEVQKRYAAARRVRLRFGDEHLPSLYLFDQKGNPRAVLGEPSLKLSTGSTERRAPSSLVLFNEKGTVEWAAP